jgi:hypothetical protein
MVGEAADGLIESVVLGGLGEMKESAHAASCTLADPS